MQSGATTIRIYLDELPADRRAAIEAVRQVILENLDPDFEEGMQYGMIGYYLPHRVYPAGYHCDPKQPLPLGGLASQKNHMALYLMPLYSDRELERWFRERWAKTGKKLDMGKSCIRFKKLDDLALDVIADLLKRVSAKKYIAIYESILGPKSRPSGAKAGSAKASAATSAPTKPASKAAIQPASRRPTRKAISTTAEKSGKMVAKKTARSRA